MCAAPSSSDTLPPASGAAPFVTVLVTMTRQEHIELVQQASSWKSLHARAVARAQWREGRYRRALRQLQELAEQREAALRAELELAQAKICDLQQRVFGRKSERSKGGSEQQAQASVARAPRGQQRGAPGHGRSMLAHLPERAEFVALDSPQCPACGEPLDDFPGTEDSQVLEIEVSAYKRMIRRRRYRRSCQCDCVAGIVTAPPPARLIERGKFGVSVWISVLGPSSCTVARAIACCRRWPIMG